MNKEVDEMNIIQRIYKQSANYKLRTGGMPCVVYLGTADMLELDKALEYQHYYRSRQPSVERTKVCGLYVYVVDALHHLNVV